MVKLGTVLNFSPLVPTDFFNRKWSKEIGTLIGANLYIKKWINLQMQS